MQVNDQAGFGVSVYSQAKPSEEHVRDATCEIDVPLSWIAKHLGHSDKLGMLLATLLHHRICDSFDRPNSFDLSSQNLTLNNTYGFQGSNRVFAFCDTFLKRLETLIDPEKMKAFLAE